jgi:hypothetical protein
LFDGEADLLGVAGGGGVFLDQAGEALEAQGAGRGFEVGLTHGANGANFGQGGLEAGQAGDGPDLAEGQTVGAAQAHLGHGGAVPVFEQVVDEFGEAVGVEALEGVGEVEGRRVVGLGGVAEEGAAGEGGGFDAFCLGCVHGAKVQRGGGGVKGEGAHVAQTAARERTSGRWILGVPRSVDTSKTPSVTLRVPPPPEARGRRKTGRTLPRDG